MLLQSPTGFKTPIIYNESHHLPCHATSLALQNETWALEDCRNNQGPVLNPRLVFAASWSGLLLLTVLQMSKVAPSFFEKQMYPTYATKPSLVIFAERKE